MDGPSNEGVFGIRLKGIGDINVDGYNDYAIYSYGVGIQLGTIRIYPGGETLSSEPFAILRGTLDHQMFGRSFTGGDLNNDGYIDLVVGSPFTAPFGYRGRVFVYFGSNSFDTEPDWITYGVDQYFRYGVSVETGDLNGDGIDDLAIGDVNTDTDSGNVHIFFGGDSFDTDEDVTIASSDGSIGWHITVGDITGDGIDDLINFDFSSVNNNIYFGSANFDSIPDDVLDIDDMEASIGNVNLDLIEDLLMGSASEYVVRVYRGGYPFDHQPDYVVHYGDFSTSFGGNIVALGDVNGDGAGDFLVSEPFGGTQFYYEGQAYIFLGDTTPVVSVKSEHVSPVSMELSLSAYPNPFNDTVQIEYILNHRGRVNITVFNIRGELIRSLVDSTEGPGKHSLKLRSDGLPSGIYFIRLETRREYAVTKVLLIK